MVADDRAKVLIAGGGVAALEAALALRELAPDRARVELLAPASLFWYQPLSVAEPFGLGEAVRLEIDALATRIGATRVAAGLTGIDAWRHIAHTTTNVELHYDVLLIACGALPMPAVRGASTFRGVADTELVVRLLDDLEAGRARSAAFVVPGGATWALPAYELALLTARHIRDRGAGDIALTVVTPEVEPLQLFGPPASDAIRTLLDAAGIELRTSAYAVSYDNGVLHVLPDDTVESDRTIALPRLAGAPLDGIPQTLDGFVRIDEGGRVHGLDDVYAAGDITSFTVKQGGIATQQADVAAEAIAAALGADVDPQPFRPVLRGLLLTGREPRFLRRELSGRPEESPVAAYDALWWPPAKVVGRYLAPFLAELAGDEPGAAAPSGTAPGTVAVDVHLDPTTLSRLQPTRLPLDLAAHDVTRVGALMDVEPVLIESHDTLGGVAERLVAHGSTAAAVVEDDELVGLVTAADIVRASAARGQPDELPVRLWMTVEPISVPPTYPASAAALLMSEYGVRHLPVAIDKRVLGMLELEQVLAAVGPAIDEHDQRVDD